MSTEYTDRTCEPGVDYLYEVVAVGAQKAISKPARLEPAGAWRPAMVRLEPGLVRGDSARWSAAA